MYMRNKTTITNAFAKKKKKTKTHDKAASSKGHKSPTQKKKHKRYNEKLFGAPNSLWRQVIEAIINSRAMFRFDAKMRLLFTVARAESIQCSIESALGQLKTFRSHAKKFSLGENC